MISTDRDYWKRFADFLGVHLYGWSYRDRAQFNANGDIVSIPAGFRDSLEKLLDNSSIHDDYYYLETWTPNDPQWASSSVRCMALSTARKLARSQLREHPEDKVRIVKMTETVVRHREVIDV